MCHKNVPKKPLLSSQQSLGTTINFASYGVCPLNAISAIIERQAASLLAEDPEVVKRFALFFDRKGYVKKFVEQARHLQK